MSRKTIIIFRKKKVHAGHHGGAWKVAYADFVTAMMSLFIVLWLMNTSDHVRKAVAGYFNDPLGHSTLTGTDRVGSAENLPLTRDNIKQIKERLEKAILQTDQLKALSNQVEIKITPEGLRIELLESKNGTFFDTGSTDLNKNGRELLTMLAKELSSVPNTISIEGHTDSQPYADDTGYSNWELSTDRANAARRLMQDTGLRHNQVSQVRGYADQRLRLPAAPLDPSNRRISLIVQYLDAAPAALPASPPAASATNTPSGQPSTPPSMPPGSPANQAKPSAAVPVPPAAKTPPPPPQNVAARLLARLHGQ
jgi:chemotaxis protein MotB